MTLHDQILLGIAWTAGPLLAVIFGPTILAAIWASVTNLDNWKVTAFLSPPTAPGPPQSEPTASRDPHQG